MWQPGRFLPHRLVPHYPAIIHSSIKIMAEENPASHSAYDLRATPPKALCFDVFGTVVNWRKTVTATLIENADSKLKALNLSSETLETLSKMTELNWGEFAQQWRNSYMQFVIGYTPERDEWLDIDTHHYQSLVILLKKYNLSDMYDGEEVKKLSKIWHYLEPWSDSSQGLLRLGTRFATSTLSNGNHSLLKDLNEFGNLGFQIMQSAEDFKAYKPHSSVYKGACQNLGLEAKDVAMVAAHLGDLKYARGTGMRTIYVERKQEEGLDRESDEYKYAKTWVDMWITQDEEGLNEVANRFGLP